jgi:hypothetical protein
MNAREFDLQKFSRLLEEKLALIDQESLIEELHEWNQTAFTTSSEFLGEMKLILKKVNSLKNLDKLTKKSVKDHITAINKALKQR